MKRFRYFWLALFLAALAAQACWAQSQEAALFQTSTIAALKAGQYDGKTTFGELKKHGDMGLGTLNGLDGEMVAVGGEFFRIGADGKVNVIGAEELTPFAMVTKAPAEKKVPLEAISGMEQLRQALDSHLRNPDGVYAIEIDGVFKALKVRSVPKQNKPYPGLEEALKNQVEFNLKDVPGTLVGFRMPAYMDGVNVPGYHFHFISQDHKAGGHVLDCVLEKGEGKISAITTVELKLPE